MGRQRRIPLGPLGILVFYIRQRYDCDCCGCHCRRVYGMVDEYGHRRWACAHCRDAGGHGLGWKSGVGL